MVNLICIDQALHEYENFLHGEAVEVKQAKLPTGLCPCGTAMVIEQRMMWLCPSCGHVDDLAHVVEAGCYVAKKVLYQRRSYFIERMNLIAGYKQSRSPQYRSIVAKCGRYRFRTIRGLRRLMKRLGFNKFYKYIYNIFFDIKKRRLITLSQQQVATLADDFVTMESFFKQNKEKHGRNNIFSYSVMIYMILKRHKIKGYRHMLLPLQ